MTKLRIRRAVRGLMIDPQDRVLLTRLRFKDGFDGWITPGGGIEEGEDEHQALIREVDEETGAPEIFVGPRLWHRTMLLPDAGRGQWDGQHSLTFLVPTRGFEPAPALSPEELAAENMVDVQWWTIGEIADAEADVVKPDGLAGLIERVLEHGAPEEPWDLGTHEGRRRPK